MLDAKIENKIVIFTLDITTNKQEIAVWDNSCSKTQLFVQDIDIK